MWSTRLTQTGPIRDTPGATRLTSGTGGGTGDGWAYQVVVPPTRWTSTRSVNRSVRLHTDTRLVRDARKDRIMNKLDLVIYSRLSICRTFGVIRGSLPS